MKKYTWDELFVRAEGCAFLSPELKAKDEARFQIGELIKKEKTYNIEDCDCPEDEIEYYLEHRSRPLFFDERGNILNTIWFRAGMEAQISDEEMEVLTNYGDREKPTQLMKRIIGRAILNGETYILGKDCSELDGYDNPAREIIFDFDHEPFGKEKVFRIGQNYSRTDWFTGGTTLFVVKSIENATITMNITRYEIDGVHQQTESFTIETDDNGNERILVTEYAGEKGYIYAKR